MRYYAFIDPVCQRYGDLSGDIEDSGFFHYKNFI